MQAWNGWYHCIGHTYGSWLRGDERGWRARHHREHVDGDYRNPPAASAHVSQRELSRALRKRPAVALTPVQREAACAALAEKLMSLHAEVVELCVGATHFHVLVRFANWQSPGIAIPGLCSENSLQDGRDPVPRHVIGMAKKHAAFVLREHGLVGGAWSTRSKIEPVRSRAHQLKVVAYIRRHAEEGGAVWSMLQRRAAE